jgi:hypothetical protein
MFGPKLTNVFRSRWHALLWAGFVMLTAYCSVPAQNEQGDAEAIAALVAAANRNQDHNEPAPHANPWAKEGR